MTVTERYAAPRGAAFSLFQDFAICSGMLTRRALLAAAATAVAADACVTPTTAPSKTTPSKTTPSKTTPSKTTATDDDFAAIDALVVEHMRQRNTPGGALAVVKDGRLVHARGFGVARRGQATPVEPTSLFRIASVSKTFTAVAVLVLLQEHADTVHLDTPAFALLGIEPFLIDEPLDERLARVTIRQLLHHTSGMLDRDKHFDPMFKSRDFATVLQIPPPAGAVDIIRVMSGAPLDAEPGTVMAYSNFGYCVLGRVIEKVSGLDYETYVKTKVLTPMGITRMRLARSLHQWPDEVGYHDEHLVPSVFPPHALVPACDGGSYIEAMDSTAPRSNNHYYSNAWRDAKRLNSHGGWAASAVDLARFAAALGTQGPTLLTASGRRAFYGRPPAPVGVDASGHLESTFYAAGQYVRVVGDEAGGQRHAWHGGTMAGCNSTLIRFADGTSWAAVFNQRSVDPQLPDVAIEGAVNDALLAMTRWPEHDLFERFA